ncbi:putative SNF-related serine/threonine-protein kinase [Hypsibius exemplaris]|uniref:SNF-related serine/threonine-protein kinase n=1 Tax=Hypsibius exemplaris TaxID=2072580 RepID=A0A1W0X1W5_HYPEX|nr:putative SNF-related serine/threonine-protein kinase [Hypsibius exemplaris]
MSEISVLRLAGIHIEELISRGKYSAVYRGIDGMISPFPVAVKITKLNEVSPLSAGDAVREAVVWSDISHPNICSFHGSFRRLNKMFLILDFVPGQDLLNLLLGRPEHLVSKERAEGWIAQLVGAVDYLHGCCIAHRDLKLENILVDERKDIVRLCDFGFAKKVFHSSKETRCCGSTSYASPQILQGLPYDAKAADVWALGCVLYALLTGALPFTDTVGIPTLLALQRNQLFEWNHPHRYSRGTRQLVQSMLEFHERKRISSGDLARAVLYKSPDIEDCSSLRYMSEISVCCIT